MRVLNKTKSYRRQKAVEEQNRQYIQLFILAFQHQNAVLMPGCVEMYQGKLVIERVVFANANNSVHHENLINICMYSIYEQAA